MKSAMGKSLLRALALAIGAALAGGASQAAVVTLTPTSTTTSRGVAVVVDVSVSALGTGNSLGGFDLDVGYDQAPLSFTGAAFGPALGNPALMEALTSVPMAGPGLLDISEVSLLTPAQLAARQPASFSVLTLSSWQ